MPRRLQHENAQLRVENIALRNRLAVSERAQNSGASTSSQEPQQNTRKGDGMTVRRHAHPPLPPLNHPSNVPHVCYRACRNCDIAVVQKDMSFSPAQHSARANDIDNIRTCWLILSTRLTKRC